MTYDKAWLDRINRVRHDIPHMAAVIEKIPSMEDRELITKQFTILSDQFSYDLYRGMDTRNNEFKIYELYRLAVELVEGVKLCDES